MIVCEICRTGDFDQGRHIKCRVREEIAESEGIEKSF